MQAQTTNIKPAAELDEDTRQRMATFEEHIRNMTLSVHSRDTCNIGETLNSWLEIAADTHEHQSVRIAALQMGVTPLINLLSFAVKAHREDDQANLVHNFATNAEARIERLLGSHPSAAQILNSLLFIAESKAHDFVRLAALTSFTAAKNNFLCMDGNLISPEQQRREKHLAKSFQPMFDVRHHRPVQKWMLS